MRYVAEVIVVDGQQRIRLRDEHGFHIGTYASVEAIQNEGIDLADVEIVDRPG